MKNVYLQIIKKSRDNNLETFKILNSRRSVRGGQGACLVSKI